MRSFTAWLADVLIGPRCPYPNCSYWARGPRTLAHHLESAHLTGGDAAIVAGLMPQTLILPDWRTLTQHQRDVWMNSALYLHAVGQLAFAAQVVAREHA